MKEVQIYIYQPAVISVVILPSMNNLAVYLREMINKHLRITIGAFTFWEYAFNYQDIKYESGNQGLYFREK